MSLAIYSVTMGHGNGALYYVILGRVELALEYSKDFRNVKNISLTINKSLSTVKIYYSTSTYSTAPPKMRPWQSSGLIAKIISLSRLSVLERLRGTRKLKFRQKPSGSVNSVSQNALVS